MAQSLAELDRIDRDKLVDKQGRTFKEFRRGLKARFWRVWFDIAAGYVALATTCIAIALLDARYPRAWPLVAALGAVPLAYFIAFIQLFFHEAAHYNLASTRRANDFLADLFVGLMIGQSVQAYRVVHFDHHRLLGTRDDTERSYFDALSLRFVVESLVGIRLVRVVLARRAHVAARGPKKQLAQGRLRLMLLLGLLLNLGIMGASAVAQCWALFFAWPFAMLVVHPAINALRQLLEHRRLDATRDVNYHVQDQGVMTRMFGSGPLSSTLGGAGFNRHLLHHWDPQLSYTRFAELEMFLLETEAEGALRSVKTSYGRVFVQLLRAP
jgi:fatty acid desaturase